MQETKNKKPFKKKKKKQSTTPQNLSKFQGNDGYLAADFMLHFGLCDLKRNRTTNWKKSFYNGKTTITSSCPESLNMYDKRVLFAILKLFFDMKGKEAIYNKEISPKIKEIKEKYHKKLVKKSDTELYEDYKNILNYYQKVLLKESKYNNYFKYCDSNLKFKILEYYDYDLPTFPELWLSSRKELTDVDDINKKINFYVYGDENKNSYEYYIKRGQEEYIDCLPAIFKFKIINLEKIAESYKYIKFENETDRKILEKTNEIDTNQKFFKDIDKKILSATFSYAKASCNFNIFLKKYVKTGKQSKENVIESLKRLSQSKVFYDDKKNSRHFQFHLLVDYSILNGNIYLLSDKKFVDYSFKHNLLFYFDIFLSLKSEIAKALYLYFIGNKNTTVKYKTLKDAIGLDDENFQNKALVRQGLNELKNIKFIKDFKIENRFDDIFYILKYGVLNDVNKDVALLDVTPPEPANLQRLKEVVCDGDNMVCDGDNMVCDGDNMVCDGDTPFEIY